VNGESRNVNDALRAIVERSAWRKELASDYETTARRLQDAYGRVLPRLESAADAVSRRVAEWVDANSGSKPDGTFIRNDKTITDLINRVRYEMNAFSALIGSEGERLQDGAVETGSNAALEMAMKTSGGLAGEISAAWNQPAPESLVRLVGYAESDAFREKVSTFGDNAARNLTDTLLTFVAQGKNPLFIARTVRTWFGIPYTWAENAVRTMQLYSYRTANHATYAANSDIVEGWVWSASLDGRVCISCVNQHGILHPNTEILNDHHRGRCAPVPKVRGTRWYDRMVSGQEWFEAQSERAQREKMGNAMYEAWKAGKVSWSDLSKPYTDKVYGEMLAAPSLKSILGSAAQRYYSYAK